MLLFSVKLVESLIYLCVLLVIRYNCGDVGRYESETTVVSKASSSTSPKQGGKREEGWKEVVRK